MILLARKQTISTRERSDKIAAQTRGKVSDMAAVAAKPLDVKEGTPRARRAPRRPRANGERADRGVQRDEILRVATEEFGARGYRSTNLRHVATRLGVTRQALYHYFPRKHDILVTLFMNYFDDLEANLRAAAKDAPAGESFRSMMRSHLVLMAGRPWISSVFEREEGQIPRRAAAIVRERRRALHQLFVDAYNEGVRAGVLRKADGKLVVSIVLGVAGWLHRWYHIDGKLKPEEFGAYAEELLFDGIGGAKRA